MVNGILRKLVILKESNSLPLPKMWRVMIAHKHLLLPLCTLILMANSGKGFSRADLVTKLNLLKVPHEISLHLNDFVCMKKGLQIVIQAGLLKVGLCSVQDESAGLVVSVVDPQHCESIIDCCAAPGGKILYMASLLSGQGMVYAIDMNEGRLRILKETAKLHQVDGVITTVVLFYNHWLSGMVYAIDMNEGRLRILKETAKLHQVDGVITTIHADMCSYADNNSMKFHKVLLDAPCSGVGVLTKRADLRWNRRLEDMEELKNLQDQLLDAATQLVKPGGVLVYSSCSIYPEENEERTAAFLLRHPVQQG